MFAAEAAAELLVRHRAWLCRNDFVDRFVELDGLVEDGAAMAWVDWVGAVAGLEDGQLPCSGGEAAVLRVGASLAEGVRVDLAGALRVLDEHNVALVAAAVRHAGGIHRCSGTAAQVWA